jgi:high-affinity iron transporter
LITNYLIGLREGLEAALIIGVLVAYLVRTRREDLLPAVWSGVSVALGIALAVGAILTFGQRRLPPRTMEILEGVLGIAAAALMTWMVFWMARTARLLRNRLESSLDRAIGIGRGAVLALSLVAVGREGLELALFLWAGITTAGSTAIPQVGATLGILSAVALGWTIYKGAVRIDLGAFFRWTGLFLIVLAAGVFAHGLRELQEAGVVRGFDDLAFDVSAQVPPSSWYGALLRGVFNFTPAPTVLEVAAWLAYLVAAFVPFTRVIRHNAHPPRDHRETTREHPVLGTPIDAAPPVAGR